MPSEVVLSKRPTGRGSRSTTPQDWVSENDNSLGTLQTKGSVDTETAEMLLGRSISIASLASALAQNTRRDYCGRAGHTGYLASSQDQLEIR